MSRRAQDPVEAAFDRWADLSPEQKKEFAWSMEGYNKARREAIRDNGGVEPDRVAPRTRQRKAKHIDITSRPDKVLGPAELAQMSRGVLLTSDIPPKSA